MESWLESVALAKRKKVHGLFPTLILTPRHVAIVEALLLAQFSLYTNPLQPDQKEIPRLKDQRWS